MDEVDGIIVRSLKSIGCDIEEDVHSLGQFSTELIVEAVARCLRVIDNSIDVHYKLPPNMAARFRVGTSLATAIQGLGYQGDLGYQTFLYSNEADIRRLLMFLVDRLPKERSDVDQEPLSASAMLQKSIAAEVSRRLSQVWVPPYCQKWSKDGSHSFHACQLLTPRGLHDRQKTVPAVVQRYYSSNLKFVNRQPPQWKDFPSSVLETNATSLALQHEWETEWNQQGLASRMSVQDYKLKKRERVRQRIIDQLRLQSDQIGSGSSAAQDLGQLLASMGGRESAASKSKGSRFMHVEKLQFAQDEEKLIGQIGTGDKNLTEGDQQKKRDEEVNSLKENLEQIVATVENLEKDVKKLSLGINQMNEQTQALEAENQSNLEAYKVRKRTFDLLPEADTNISKLEALVEESTKRLVNLADQWEKHRVPLIEEYRTLKQLSDGELTESQKKIEEIREIQSKMKDLASEASEKDELYKQLVVEYERMAKDVNRSAYTQRILEIVANIKKQNQEIDKVLIDTKSVQKEINQMSGVLERTFTVTDELLFKDAKKDEAVRKAYKFLASLHENCDMLIKSVEETGVIMREIKDLEDQLDQENKSKMEDNLDRISSDYLQMKKENLLLLNRLKNPGNS